MGLSESSESSPGFKMFGPAETEEDAKFYAEVERKCKVGSQKHLKEATHMIRSHLQKKGCMGLSHLLGLVDKKYQKLIKLSESMPFTPLDHQYERSPFDQSMEGRKDLSELNI